ncbi:hypothetical protein DFQ10_103292 [Winogradskyella eximia]|jgi:D-aminopeptidase|uniref:Uncharacterized protein n=1 Tax=Winogradskyella eximia TaxID=262006 RepID=A0A3D9H512_9FLAO|nr:hypothetical protein [Winogradskyella eximia]RED44605.1 hypothetical protein DFQ10_103292 [Winogradskyella eximia]|tara:strand:- start:661 stop:885 length:225 start_codon:yes stop_codon:yes gene_type:complete
MKPTNPKALPCAIFGHNFERSKTYMDHTSELICRHCEAVVVTDSHGNFENHTVVNSQIADTLQQLYRLTRHFPK